MACPDEYGQKLVEETRHLVAATKEKIVSARETDPVDPAYIENLKEVLQSQEALLMRFELV